MLWMQERRLHASPLRGEAGAQRRVRGKIARRSGPLTPTLSPVGRGGEQ